MATIVCHQGLKSCLESTTTVEPRALRLTLSSTRPFEAAGKLCSVKPEPGGWSFVEALFNGPKVSDGIGGDRNVYVHPLEKRSLSGLSERSLELCTENLGSETGSDDVLDDDDDIFSLLSSSASSSRIENPQTGKSQRESRQAKSCDFPPPLTTISGSESIQVRSHRENGRLVIKAEKAPSRIPVFRAERCNGRLRLCLLECSTSNVEYEEEEEEEDDEEEEELENDGINKPEEEEGEGERAETTTFRRRDRCKEGEHEKQRMGKMGGFLGGYNVHNFILDLPV